MSSDQSETAVDPAAFVVVRTPAFFVALATDSQDANAARDPTEAETLEMTRRTEDQIRSQIAEDHPTGLVDFRLSLVRSETGTVRPDERFRLYHEYECAATFAAAAVAVADHHPPKQDELLALIMRCADIDYVKSLREMDGTPYAAVTMMSIQMVGMDEAAVEAAEEKIAARKKIDEETAEQKTDEQATKNKVKEEVTKKVQKKTTKKKKTKKEATKKEANEEAAKKDSDDEKAAATEAKPNANEETGDEVKVAEEKAIEEAATKAKQEVAPKKKKKKKKSKKEKQRTKEGSLSPSSDRSIATNSSEESSVHSVTDAKEKIDLSPSSNESIATNSSEETSVHSITDAKEKIEDETKVVEEKPIEEAITEAKEEVAPKKKKKKKSEKEKKRTKEGHLSPGSDRSIATNSSEETSVHRVEDATEKNGDKAEVADEKAIEEAATKAKPEVAPKKKKKKSRKEKKQAKEGSLSPISNRSIVTDSSEERSIATNSSEERSIATNSSEETSEETSVHRVEDATEKTGEAEIAEEKVIEETATKANPEVAPKKKKKKSRKKKKQAKEGSLSPSSDRSIATDSSEERSIVTNSSEETSGHRVEDIIEKNGDKAIVAEEKVVKEAATETKQEVAPKKKNKKSKKEKKPAKEQSVSPSSNRVITNDPSDETSGNRFKTGMVYTAFKLDCCESNPPEEEYEKLRLKTQDYFTERLEEQFGSQLSEVQLSIHRKEFGSAKPDKHYNVYVEWDIETLCKPDPTSTTATADRQERVVADGVADTEANPENLTRFLVQGTDLMDYMLKAVQPIRKSAFANVTMGFIGGKLPTESMF